MCMSLCCSSHLLWRYIILRDHLHHYPITGTSKCLESTHLSSQRIFRQANRSHLHKRGTTWTLQYCSCYCSYSSCGPKLGWQYRFLRTCVPNGSVWYAEIWNKKSPTFIRRRGKFSAYGCTTWLHHEFGLRSTYSVMSQARCPLISWISCSKSCLPY